MKYFKEFYEIDNIKIEGTKKKICNNIFTFDIETTNLLKLNNEIIEGSQYLNLSEQQKKDCEFLSYMYIWQFSIDEEVYYGRTWQDFVEFLDKLEQIVPQPKIVFVHNLAFEFQALRSIFNFYDVFSRVSRHTMKCSVENYNIEFRCTLTLTNMSLEKLGEEYLLDNQKLSGSLDYNKIRNSKTILTKKELDYCELDCLTVYNYIQYELKSYERVDKIPLTQTGHIRRELKSLVYKDWKYKNVVGKAINVDPHIYNLLVQAFAGGYAHANWIYVDEILQNVDSYDFTSSYPFVMISEKYPSKEFKKCKLKDADNMLNCFAYILVVKFTNLKSRYYNHILSMSKCRNIRGARYDNGRIIQASELEITLTDIDFKLLLKFYKCEYEILESYYSKYEYLPETYYNFILDKYEKKTQLKNVDGKEDEYAREKANFNAIFGMSVTNTIRDEVLYDNELGWSEKKLSNTEILFKLLDEKNKKFLSFGYGVWVTAYARRNLLENVLKLDKYVVFCDTDSIKLVQGYDKNVINEYNNNVKEKLKKISKKKNIKFSKYSPKDIKGISHLLGLFEKEGKDLYTYKEFITQGAKKYAYKNFDDSVHITVSGVPKKGAADLNGDLNNFKDNLIFTHENSGKNLLIYNDNQSPTTIVDYQGNEEYRTDIFGSCIVPTTYELSKSLDFRMTLEDMSSRRAVYKEEY